MLKHTFYTFLVPAPRQAHYHSYTHTTSKCVFECHIFPAECSALQLCYVRYAAMDPTHRLFRLLESRTLSDFCRSRFPTTLNNPGDQSLKCSCHGLCASACTFHVRYKSLVLFGFSSVKAHKKPRWYHLRHDQYLDQRQFFLLLYILLLLITVCASPGRNIHLYLRLIGTGSILPPPHTSRSFFVSPWHQLLHLLSTGVCSILFKALLRRNQHRNITRVPSRVVPEQLRG